MTEPKDRRPREASPSPPDGLSGISRCERLQTRQYIRHELRCTIRPAPLLLTPRRKYLLTIFMSCVLSGMLKYLSENVIESKTYTLETLAYTNSGSQGMSPHETQRNYRWRVERGLADAQIALQTTEDAAPPVMPRLPTTSALDLLPYFDSPPQLPLRFDVPAHPSMRRSPRAIPQAQSTEDPAQLPPPLLLPHSVQEALQPQPLPLPEFVVQELVEEHILTNEVTSVNAFRASSHPGSTVASDAYFMDVHIDK